MGDLACFTSIKWSYVMGDASYVMGDAGNFVNLNLKGWANPF